MKRYMLYGVTNLPETGGSYSTLMGDYETIEEATHAAFSQPHRWDAFTIIDGFTYRVVRTDKGEA